MAEDTKSLLLDEMKASELREMLAMLLKGDKPAVDKNRSKSKKAVVSDRESGSDSDAEHRKSVKKVKKRGVKVAKRGVPVLDTSDGDSSSEEEVRCKKRRKYSGLQSLPKNLVFGGKDNWRAFKQKFTLFAKACEWTDEECADCLCLCLKGKAADYYATITDRNEHLSYRCLMKKLELRFGVKELVETARLHFQQAVQEEDESLEEWGDRVLTLATRAFRDLPKWYTNEQAVLRFCQGLYDKAAGLDVGMRKYETTEEALEHVKWYQHVHQVVYGKTKVTCRTREPEVEGPRICETRVSGAASSLTRAEVEAIVKKTVEKLLAEMARERNDGDRRSVGPDVCYQCGKTGHFRRTCPERRCYRCQAKGHLKRNCLEGQGQHQNGRSVVSSICSNNNTNGTRAVCCVERPRVAKEAVGEPEENCDSPRRTVTGMQHVRSETTQTDRCVMVSGSEGKQSDDEAAAGMTKVAFTGEADVQAGNCGRSDDYGVTEIAEICKLSSASRFKVNIQVGSKDVQAVVDTAAEVTIISEEVFKALKIRPAMIKDVKLLTAGKELSMSGFIVGPVRLQIGSKVYKEYLNVAPIEQDMLLGLDLLYKRAVLNMPKRTMIFDDEVIPLMVEKFPENPLVAGITVCRDNVPSEFAVCIKCQENRASSGAAKLAGQGQKWSEGVCREKKAKTPRKAVDLERGQQRYSARGGRTRQFQGDCLRNRCIKSQESRIAGRKDQDRKRQVRGSNRDVEGVGWAQEAEPPPPL